MCGIVGLAGNLAYKDKAMLRDMIHVCEMRGEDSTGMFHVKNGDREAVSYKTVEATAGFFASSAWDKLSLYDKRVVIAHCRKSTVGASTRFNAHPFTHDHITGVHNGTLRNWRDLPGETLSTDSNTLYAGIAANGVKETLEATDGAYALIYWDAAEGTLNVIRNKERPLCYAFSEAGDAVLFASEAWMITINAARHGYKLQNLTPKEDTACFVEYVPEDVLWRMKPVNATRDALSFLEDVALKGGVNPAKRAAAPFHSPYRTAYEWEEDANNGWYPQKRLQGLPPPVNQHRSADASSNTKTSTFGSATTGGTAMGSLPSKATLTLVANNKSGGSASSSESGPSKLNDSIKALFRSGSDVDYILGKGGLVLNSEEFDKLVDPNCVWCQAPYSFDEIKNEEKLGDWVTDSTFLCATCHGAGAATGYGINQQPTC